MTRSAMLCRLLAIMRSALGRRINGLLAVYHTAAVEANRLCWLRVAALIGRMGRIGPISPIRPIRPMRDQSLFQKVKGALWSAVAGHRFGWSARRSIQSGVQPPHSICAFGTDSSGNLLQPAIRLVETDAHGVILGGAAAVDAVGASGLRRRHHDMETVAALRQALAARFENANRLRVGVDRVPIERVGVGGRLRRDAELVRPRQA